MLPCSWDYRYYDRKYTEQHLSLDDSLVKEYFPVAFVVPAVLKIYQNLLGVRFEPIKSAELWHPEAELFSVWEADAKDESGFVGYCHLDLFPRGTCTILPLIGVHELIDFHRGQVLACRGLATYSRL